MFSAASAEANSAFIAGGKGNDTVYVDAASGKYASIKGGDGKDSIYVAFSAVTNNSLIDAASDDGADTINLALDTYSSTSVYGGGGNDSIVVSGSTDAGTNLFVAGTGDDTVVFQSAGADTISGSTIKGGAGNDSIYLNPQALGAVQSGLIQGGKGNDTITIATVDAIGSAGSVATTLKGGAGADSLTISAVGGETGVVNSGTFAFDSFGQSTLTEMDTLSFSTAAISADADASYGSGRINASLAWVLTPAFLVLVLLVRFLHRAVTSSGVATLTTASLLRQCNRRRLHDDW